MRLLSRCGLAALGVLLVASACSSFDSSSGTSPDASAEDDGSVLPVQDAAQPEDSGSPADATAYSPDASPDAGVDAGPPCTVTCRSHFCDQDGGCHPLVFVTEDSYDGTFDSPFDAGAPAYGAARGDYVCNQVVDGGTSFIALLSTTERNALERITGGEGAHRPVRRQDGLVVAPSYADLFSDTTGSSLDAGINLSNTGSHVSLDDMVWTGTLTNGKLSTHNCNNWTNNFRGDLGDFGLAGETNGSWVLASTNLDFCNVPSHLYCFEIVP